MNAKNSKTSDPHRLLLNLSEKINLKRSDKYPALTDLSIYFTLKNIKKSYKTINVKHQLLRGIDNLNYVMDHILHQVFKVILSILSKKKKHLLIILQ